jgi:hypothetical protein
MEVLDQAPDVVGVRMGVEEGVDEQPAFFVSIEPLPELLGDVRRIVVRVVGGLADVYVAQDAFPRLGRTGSCRRCRP